MSENAVVAQETLNQLAERVIQRYVRELLSVSELVKRIEQTWQASISGETPQGPALESLARGLCSQALCEACRMPGGWMREVAFKRLTEYLIRTLDERGGAIRYTTREVREEVIQQTLVEILQSLRRERGKPEQPMAFLGWARVILHRQITAYWRQQPHQELLSLEGQENPLLAEIIDEHALDPLDMTLWREDHEELRVAILSLRNPHYREVLLLYLGEMEANEMANLLHVPVADIYLWHHRALKALHKQLNPPETQKLK
ncbi:MAG TPA: sigma-70 family RNA polymerase sigma factor [Ktedonobacteraceae bacterium]